MKLALFLTLILMPNISFAAQDEAISYSFITSMMSTTENFTLTLYEKLTASFESLFTKLAVITLVIHALRWQLGKPDVVSLLKFFFTLVAVKTLAFTPGVFESWFYRPVMETMYALPAFVIKVSSGTLNYASNLDAIKSMLASMDKAIKTMRLTGELIMLNKGFWSATWMFIQGMILNLVWTGLYIVFVVMFTIGIVAAHVMLAAAPFAVSLIAFEGLRGVSYNVIRNFFSYTLIPFFAAVAMGMTLSAMNSIIEEADQALAANNVALISDHFFLEAILIGIFSWFFHIKAGQFASQVIGGSISDFGSGFATMMGLGGAAAGLGGKLVGKMGGNKLASGAKNLAGKALGGAGRGIASGAAKGLQYTRLVADQIKQDRAKYS